MVVIYGLISVGVTLDLASDETVSAQSWQEPQDSVSDQLSDDAPGFASDMSGSNSFLSFPIVDNPQELLGMLFGQDPTLVRCDLPAFHFSESFDQFMGVVPVGPVPVTIGLRGSLGIASAISFGYDTLGLRNAYSEGSAFAITDGFYISDTDSTGRDVPELEVFGSVAFYGEVGGGFDIGVISAEARAGVEGGLKTTVTADLIDDDGDGKVRFDEFSGFDLDGEISCYVDLYAKVGGSFLGFGGSKKYNVELVDITLVDFTINNDDRILNPPILATMESGTLYLNMGDRASYALNGGQGPYVWVDGINGIRYKQYLNLGIGQDVSEEFEVVNSGSGTVIVKAWGFEQEYGSIENPITSIVANGGNGDDIIEIKGGVVIPTYINGGIGNDHIVGGSGIDIITGGQGSDYIDGSSGEDMLYGYEIGSYAINAGSDTIYGGRGDDRIYGGGGDDTIYGGAGDDTIYGGAGNDTVQAEAGEDTIYGDSGSDILYGNQGIDTIYGGADADIIIGGADDDILYGYLLDNFNNYLSDTDTIYGDFAAGTIYIDLLQGNAGSDLIYGQGGDDQLYAEAGEDTVYAGVGNDTVYGGIGNDLLLGETGNDIVFGGIGNDYAYGGAGNDSVSGGYGDDLIDGGAGDDSLNGNDGNDLIYAGSGNDIVNAGVGNDIIYGGLGDDVIDGHVGADNIYGNAGNDQLSGGLGDDVIICGAGDDYVFGQLGADEISGISGANRIWGGYDEDRIYGGVDADMIYGDAGDDQIYGLSGNDTINGGFGLDTLDGGLGDDVIYGGFDNDRIYGGLGDDDLFGDDGNDYIDGGFGVDIIDGGIGNDQLYAGYGSGGEIQGGIGDDVIHGSDDGIDYLYGNLGDDVIYGYAGNDHMEGNDGRDIIYGGYGDDVIYGGAGSDILLGEGDHDVIFGDAFGENGNSVDYLYGDFGSNQNEPGSGKDQLYGQGGDDFIFGEGEDDQIVDTDGVNTINYGSGERAIAGDIILPNVTSDPQLVSYTAADSISSMSYIADTDNVTWQTLAIAVNSETQLLEPAIVASAMVDDQLVAAWVDSSFGKYDIVLSMNVSGNWVKLVDGIGNAIYGNSSVQSRQPSVVMANDGNVLVSWTDYDVTGNAKICIGRYDIDQGSFDLLGSSIDVDGSSINSKIVVTGNGPVVFWQSTLTDESRIFARHYDNGLWQDLGAAGAVVSTGMTISGYDIAEENTNMAISWTEEALSGDSLVFVSEYNGSQWQQLPAYSDSSTQISMANVEFYNGNVYLTCLEQADGRQKISVASYANGQWDNYTQFDARLNERFTDPKLTVSTDGLELSWLAKNTDDVNTVDMVSVNYDLDSHSFNTPAYTELDNHSNLIDNYNSFDISAGSGGLYAIWLDVNSGITIAAKNIDETIVYLTAGESIQQLLDNSDFGPGDVIYLDSDVYDGFEIGADDAGVAIVGSKNFSSVVSSEIIINADDITIQNLRIENNMTVFGSSVDIIANDLYSCLLTLVDTDSSSIENNSFHNSGIVISSNDSNVNIYGNYFTDSGIAIELVAESSGVISTNVITNSQVGIDLQSDFSGLIADNVISGSTTGIQYSAAANLVDNTISGNTVGMNVAVSNIADAPGIFGSGKGNTFTGNDTGIILFDSYIANQMFDGNIIGISGSGRVGGNDLSQANIIEHNTIGIRMDDGAKIAYNKIGCNQTGISAGSDQIISNNVLYENSLNGIVVDSVDTVYIVNNTIYSEDSNSVSLINGAREVEVINNILWSENGYALNISNSSREGFFSDYNTLYTGSQGHLVHWVIDFDDLLDWQVDVGLFDANSIGSTDVNPGLAKPRFNGMASNDYSLIDIAAGLRLSNLGNNSAYQAMDIGLSAEVVNLLANPNFEQGVSGWRVSDGSASVTDSEYAFDGEGYFTAGMAAQGSAMQTIDLAVAGYDYSLVDQGGLYAIFGGRLRSADENAYDTGSISLAFIDSSGQVIYSSELSPDAYIDRWNLAGDQIAIPAGARKVRYTFTSDRQVGNANDNNDAYLDNAFLRIVDNSNPIDMGASSLADEPISSSPKIALRYPEMYLDWQRDDSHIIRWDTFGNNDDLQVKIDIYQDTAEGTVYLQTIAQTSDDGEYSWLPADSGIDYGEYGLRVFVSLIGSDISFDISSESFNIPENSTEYFVNDNQSDDDQYTTAVGDNRNTGRRIDSPKPNPVNLLNVYSLGAGDELFIDAGNYELLYPVVLSGTIGIADDEGFVVSGVDTLQTEFALIDPLFSTSSTVILDNADYVSMQYLVLSDGYMGLYLNNDSTYFTGTNLVCNNNISDGIMVENESSLLSMTNIEASNNGQSGVRMLSGQLQPAFENITANDNGDYGVYAATAIARLKDSQASNNAETGFYLNGQQGIMIENVIAVGNANDGLAVAGAVNYIGGSKLYNNQREGVELSSTIPVTFDNNQIYSNGGYGIFAGSASVIIADHDIYDNGNYGICAGSGSDISNNNIYQNASGIKSSNSTISYNHIYDNNEYGINANGGTLDFNILGGNGDFGIYLRNAIATNNVVHSQNTGISTYSSGSVISNNRVYNNSDVGLSVTGDTKVLENVIYSNGLGIKASGDLYNTNNTFLGSIVNNLVYDNNNGISLVNAKAYNNYHPEIVNNTIHQVGGYAVSVAATENSSSDNVELKNNIISVSGDNGYGIKVDQRSQMSFSSNYNLFDLQDNSYYGLWQNKDIESFSQWQNMVFADRNSSQGDPLFVSPAGDDGVLGYRDNEADGSDDNFHLQSLYGAAGSGSLAPSIDYQNSIPGYQEVIYQLYGNQSSAIDRGDQQSSYANEPIVNGGFVNLGAYGNTSQASLSPDQYILITSPLGEELWPNGQQFNINWRTNYIAGSDNVNIVLVGQGPEYLIASETDNDGAYTWLVPDSIAPGQYHIDISKVEDVSIADSSNDFAIMEHDGRYYVNIANDNDFTDNQFTYTSGNNANSGLTALTPKASVKAVIESYDLRPGDIIYVDSGNYSMSSNIVITDQDYGFTVSGPDVIDHAAILNRGNSNSGNYVFELDGAENVVIENLYITGAYDGIYSGTSANGIVVENSTIYNNSNNGINISGNVNEVTLQDNNVRNSGGNGIYLSGKRITITGNELYDNDKRGLVVENSQQVFIDSNSVYGNTSYGIYVNSSSAMVTGNKVSGNDIGIYASASNQTYPVQISDNDVFANDSKGIYGEYNVLISGNTVYGHQGSSHYGIHVTRDAKALYNECFDNETGIYAGEYHSSRSGTVVGNITYGNEIGIQTGYYSIVSENKSYSNTIGIKAGNGYDFMGSISNNVIYANADYGILVDNADDGARIVNNTVYQPVGDAVRIENAGSDVKILNNILVSDTGYCLNVTDDSFAGFSSDYNILSGKVVMWGGTAIDNRADWYYELGFDRHSYSSDPLFVDIDGTDNVLGYDTENDINYGIDDNFHISSQSDALDSGSPDSGMLIEMYPNGGRVNMGAYGNTFEAASSDPQTLQLLSPIALDKYEYGSEILVSWRSSGLAGISDQVNVDLEYSIDAGANWHNLAIDLALDTDGTGSYIWQAGVIAEEIVIRISTDDAGLDISDISSIFQVAPESNSYFVNIANDTDFSDNEYTLASGDNTNSGKSPYYPMASLSALLDIYELGAGDIIYIDSGIYTMLNNLVIDSSDAGVRITGPVASGHEALFDRDNSVSGNNVLELDDAGNVVIENLAFTGGYYGIYVYGNEDKPAPTISSNSVYGNTSYGIYVNSSSAMVTGNKVSGNDIGIYASASNQTYPVQISDNDVFANDSKGIYGEYNVLISGNTVYGHQGSGHYGIHVTRDAKALYNECFDNETGIYAGEYHSSRSGTVVGNITYGNEIGIQTGYYSIVSENKSYSNTIGIKAGNGYDFMGSISNNVIYANADYGILVDNADDGARIVNNTVYQPVGDAVRIENASSDVKILNNILVSDTGYCLNVTDDSFAGFSSDYNILSGKVVMWGGTAIDNRADWYYELGFDRHSYSSDPLFVDIDGTDNVLGYDTENDINYGIDDNFHISSQSDALDSGSPDSGMLIEMYPNGGRVNMGAYGNTFEAASSDPQTLQLLSPIALDKYEYGSEILVSWRSSGLAGISDQVNVDLEYSIDAGANWHNLAIDLALDTDGTGSYIWQAGVIAEEIVIRISTDDAGLDISDISSIFQVAPESNSYFVNIANDTDFSDNEYTLASGDNTNSGKSPYYPMASLSALLDIYELGAGDIIYIDSGIYTMLNNLVIDSSDAGVRITGPVASGHEALFDRDNSVSGNNVLELDDAGNVVIENLAFTGGYYGIYVYGNEDKPAPTISSNSVYGNTSYGIYVNSSSAMVTGNKVSGNDIGIYASASNQTYPVQISDNDVFANDSKGIYGEYNVLISGNTVYGHQGSGHYGIHVTRDAKALYNECFDNETGIYAGEYHSSRSGTVVGNITYGNEIGIQTGYYSIVSENKSYSNTIGIKAGNGYDFMGSISNNVIYANADYGILVDNADDGARIVNNTVYQPVGDAVRIENASSDVKILNNILTIDTGHCLSIDSGSDIGLLSDYNLYFRSVLNNSYVARVGLTDIADLQQWRAGYNQDQSSIENNPLFIDIDGADGVLGYQQSDIHTNNGQDDNFVLSKNSPAIDAGYSWIFESGVNYSAIMDDPGVANSGSLDYCLTISSPDQFVETGQAMNWRGNNHYWSYTLPQPFNYYGVDYTSVYVHSNGVLQFGNNSSFNNDYIAVPVLLEYAAIAPYFGDIHTTGAGDDIFIDTNQPGVTTIRWDATSALDGSDIDFSVSLYDTGEIRFGYDNIVSGSKPVIGISSGKGKYELVDPDDVAGENAVIEFGLMPGVADIGAYEFNGSSFDNTAPMVVGTTPAIINDSGQGNVSINQIGIAFSESLNTIDALSVANYTLVSYGPDQIEGNADDYNIDLVPGYDAGSTMVNLVIPTGTLGDGIYKMTISGNSMHDLAGLHLPTDYVREFEVNSTQSSPPLVVNADSKANVVIPDAGDPVDSYSIVPDDIIKKEPVKLVAVDNELDGEASSDLGVYENDASSKSVVLDNIEPEDNFSILSYEVSRTEPAKVVSSYFEPVSPIGEALNSLRLNSRGFAGFNRPQLLDNSIGLSMIKINTNINIDQIYNPIILDRIIEDLPVIEINTGSYSV